MELGRTRRRPRRGGDRQLVEHHGGGLLGVHCDGGHDCDGHGARGCGQWVGHDGGSRGWLGRTGQERADGWARSGLKRQVGKIQQMDGAVSRIGIRAWCRMRSQRCSRKCCTYGDGVGTSNGKGRDGVGNGAGTSRNGVETALRTAGKEQVLFRQRRSLERC